jgi:hypothetical protein
MRFYPLSSEDPVYQQQQQRTRQWTVDLDFDDDVLQDVEDLDFYD